VLCDQTEIVDTILNLSDEGSVVPFSRDDIQNLSITRPEANQFRYIFHDEGDGEDGWDNFSGEIYPIDDDGEDGTLAVFHVDSSIARNMVKMDIDPTDPQEVYDYYVTDTVEAPFPPKYGTCISEDEEVEMEEEDQDYFNWFLVDWWLAHELLERNEIMLTDGESHWWGRGTCGQAIYMDWVITRIVNDTNYQIGE